MSPPGLQLGAAWLLSWPWIKLRRFLWNKPEVKSCKVAWQGCCQGTVICKEGRQHRSTPAHPGRIGWSCLWCVGLSWDPGRVWITCAWWQVTKAEGFWGSSLLLACPRTSSQYLLCCQELLGKMWFPQEEEGKHPGPLLPTWGIRWAEKMDRRYHSVKKSC